MEHGLVLGEKSLDLFDESENRDDNREVVVCQTLDHMLVQHLEWGNDRMTDWGMVERRIEVCGCTSTSFM